MRYVDLVVRFIAGVSLIPLTLFMLFMATMAGDSPHSGPLPSIIVLVIGSFVTLAIGFSCVAPNKLEAKLKPYIPLSRIMARAPAYLYAAPGLYYGGHFVAGIVANLIKQQSGA